MRSIPTLTAAHGDNAVPVDDGGFFTDPGRWTEPMAGQIAREAGVETLADRHWEVIRFMREQYAAKGPGPTVRVLGKTSGVSVKELCRPFPKGPAKTAAKIAGTPEPRNRI
ncbi:TusE/DsrC/DsvC family sulfur relay protein [Streptomyces caeni]|uniref:TusE/DsrC/DsvC family sulfur relay protein n=1 Tax=Streptomyces caeni TaxID=2307231 RepID=A0ABW4J2X8_9ACTN